MEWRVVEAQWIRRAVEEFERPLTQYAAHLLRDPEAARDVVQETFFRLCRQARSDVEGHLAEWLYTVCRNRAMDVLRKERRMKPLPDVVMATRHAEGPSPGQSAEHGDDMSAVLRVMGSLPVNQQEVVRLKFQQELSYKQIAAVTGLSIGNVGFLLHTALNNLRKRLSP